MKQNGVPQQPTSTLEKEPIIDTIAIRAIKSTQTKPTVVPFRKPISEELIETLTHLLQEAALGNLTGMAYAATTGQGTFLVDAVGEAHRKPIYALGSVHMLADELSRRVRGCDE